MLMRYPAHRAPWSDTDCTSSLSSAGRKLELRRRIPRASQYAVDDAFARGIHARALRVLSISASCGLNREHFPSERALHHLTNALLVLSLSRRVHSGKWGFRGTVVQEFQKSKKGERVVHKMQLAVSLDTETGF